MLLLVLAEVALIIVVVLRLVIRSCRFYIALSKRLQLTKLCHLRLGEQVLKHPVQVVFALLLPLRVHLLLRHPEVNVDGSPGAKHSRVVHSADRLLSLLNVSIEHIGVLEVLGGVVSQFERNNCSRFLKFGAALLFGGANGDVVDKHVRAHTTLDVKSDSVELER